MFEQIFKLYESLDYFGKTVFILAFITITANTLDVILMIINSVSKRKYKSSIKEDEIYVINKTKDILSYIIENYSLPNDLTVSRLTQLIYLIDWEMTKRYHRQISDIDWYLDAYGPYTSDINDEIKNNENIVIIKQDSNLDIMGFTLQVKNNTENLNYKNLTSEEIEIINKTIEDTKTKSLFDFMAYVNSTKPITDGIRYDYLNLNSFVE